MTELQQGYALIDVWNARDAAAVGRFYGDASFSDPLVPRPITGAALVAYATGIFEAFPDLHFEVHGAATGPELVMFEWSQCGTNRGSILGQPATDRYVEIPAVSVLRYAGGVLRTHVDYWDMKQLMADLGLS